MNTVRQMEVKLKESEQTRKVPELHIDADEAHITLKGGGKSQVPLISVYEGIEAHGKRKKCKNIFHISEYGMKTDDLWEKVLSEIEMRYELDETKIYLHGDGANWIAQGLEWIPKSVFVLDKYHKNKAIKQITAGLESKYRKEYEKEIREALSQEDMDLFNENVLDIYSQFPERKDKIVGAAKYLQNFVHGISICERDPQANNGGCTEPHVSHILSSRLSSRPMAWSEKTLKNLAPMLAGYEIKGKSKEEIVPNVVEKAVKCVKKTLSKGSALGLPSPSAIGALEPLKRGKVTTLYQMMKKI